MQVFTLLTQFRGEREREHKVPRHQLGWSLIMLAAYYESFPHAEGGQTRPAHPVWLFPQDSLKLFFLPSCVCRLSGSPVPLMNVRHHGQAWDRQHQPCGPADRQAVPGLQHLFGPLSQPQGPALPAHLLWEVRHEPAIYDLRSFVLAFPYSTSQNDYSLIRIMTQGK